ncbi:type II secretion system protein GspD [Pectinatus frisingensis]|uniref:type II secretion system protein GspD n=1 Tax=Pectinatus frisingensis TaxID=865 RepID=UPI001E4D4D3F|nr:hypothetical protein [Pectinatus frisingensis]
MATRSNINNDSEVSDMQIKKKITLCILGAAVLYSSGYINTHIIYAATPTTVTSTESAEDPNSFAARIKNIIDNWDKQKKDASAASEDKSSVISTPAPAAAAVSTSNTVDPNIPNAGIDKNMPPNVNAKFLDDGSVYDYDWRGTPLTQTLYAVAKSANKGIVINASLSGNVYTSLHNVTCAEVLDYLSRAFNFNWMVDADNNTIIISTPDVMKQSKVFTINYANKDKLKDELKSLGIDEKNIYANTESGTISVTGTPYELEEAAKRIAAIDRPVSQCLIVAQLIEINRGKSLDLGMQYSLPTFSHTGTDDSTSNNLPGNVWEKLTFSASAEANKELSHGKVVARPMIMVLNGQEGSVSFGDNVPVFTTSTTSTSTSVTVDYKDVGTTLKVTPVINAYTDEISMNIDAQVSNISQWVNGNNTKAPQISTRHALTSAHLHSGQSFVIGGLMSESDLDNLSGIPGLMDLPILGKLFSYHSMSKTYTEVYIMITPYIVTDNINPAELLKEVGN